MLCAAALTQLLIHEETGCRHAGAAAARLLAYLGDTVAVHDTTRQLCERASQRLIEDVEGGTPHARAA